MLLAALLLAGISSARAGARLGAVTSDIARSDFAVEFDPLSSNGTRSCLVVTGSWPCDPEAGQCCLGQYSRNVTRYMYLMLANASAACTSSVAARKLMSWTVNGRKKFARYQGPNVTVPMNTPASAGRITVCLDSLPGVPDECSSLRRLCQGGPCPFSLQLSRVTKKLDPRNTTTWTPGVTCRLGGMADLNMCNPGNAFGCSANAKCVALHRGPWGVGACSCNPGYTGDGYNTCEDINECLSAMAGDGRCGSNARCNNTDGGFSCSCEEGYTSMSVGDTLVCKARIDASLCSSTCHAKATCSNVTGTPACRCMDGFEGDGVSSCQDVDECAAGAVACPKNSACINTDGGHYCACIGGFNAVDLGNGTAFCVRGALCANVTCQPNAECVDVDTLSGSPECHCQDGYLPDATGACQAIHQCQAGSCAANAVCKTVDRIQSCKCEAGYVGDGMTSCTAEDVCAVDNGGCATPNGVCTLVMAGVVDCHCKEGYSGDGVGNCTDVNECLTANGGCHPNATCTNTDGNRTCQCNAGFEGDGWGCKAIDFCATDNGGCNANATCANVGDGKVSCECNKGFRGDGIANCTALPPPCETANGGCHPDATCFNTEANEHRICRCKPGYRGDGIHVCNDLDECLVRNGGCHPNAECTNTVGSHNCTCLPGYQGDGFNCTDVDECLVANGGCHANADCNNTEGGRACTCRAGYSGDGVGNCTDIDECAVNNGGCNRLAVCNNTGGGFECICMQGYQGDGLNCTDIDECAWHNGGCDGNATCTNTMGGRTCECNEGFLGDGVAWGWGCAVDPCSTDNGGCHANASCAPADTSDPTVYEAVCRCNDGFDGNGTHCDDVDECATGAATCHPQAWCTNTVGSYSCGCRSTYTGDGVEACEPLGGSLRCWDFEPGHTSGITTVPADMGNVVLVSPSMTRDFTCALTAEGAVRCWGRDYTYDGVHYYGVLDVPADLPPAKHVEAGDYASCALSRAGAVSCWGSYYEQQKVPQELTKENSTASICVGRYHACGVTTKGAIRCWGWNDTRNAASRALPWDLKLPGAALEVACGIEHACAVTATRSVRCWGANTAGEASVPEITAATALYAGNGATCTRATDGAWRCWGQTVKDDNFTTGVPPDLGAAKDVNGGHWIMFAATADKRVESWGWRHHHTWPPGTAIVVPDDVQGASVAVAAGKNHACAILMPGGGK